jgi:hypothetical protein
MSLIAPAASTAGAFLALQASRYGGAKKIWRMIKQKMTRVWPLEFAIPAQYLCQPLASGGSMDTVRDPRDGAAQVGAENFGKLE